MDKSVSFYNSNHFYFPMPMPMPMQTGILDWYQHFVQALYNLKCAILCIKFAEWKPLNVLILNKWVITLVIKASQIAIETNKKCTVK